MNPRWLTVDNIVTWTNGGPYATAGSGVTLYAYSFKNSVSGTVSTASPLSLPFTFAADHSALVQGNGSDDPQVDTIVIWRTVQGGSVLLYDSEIPAPTGGSSAIWSYLDSTPDTGLNSLIEAPIAFSNNPPPAGWQKWPIISEYLGAVNNSVYFSGGPDTTTGNGNEAFPR